jgi:zinc protease
MRKGAHIVAATVLALVLAWTPSAIADGGARHRLPGGVTVITKPASWNRIVAIAVAVRAGSRYDPPDRRGLASLTCSLLGEGTEAMTRSDLLDLLDGEGIDFGAYADEDLAYLLFTCTDEHVDAALEVLADMITRPSFDEDRLLRAEEQALKSLEREQTDEYGKNLTRLDGLLFAGHPYAFPPVGTAEGIKRVGREDVVEFHASQYVAGATTIAVVGNFDEESVVDRLTDLLSDYPRGAPPAAGQAVPRRDRTDVDEIYMDVPEAALAVGYLAPPVGSRDYAAVRVLVSLLGTSADARLPRALGEKGARLSDDVTALCVRHVDASAVVISVHTTDPDASVDIVEREIERVRTEPVSDEELAAARNQVVGSTAIQEQTNLRRATRLAFDYVTTGRVDALDTLLDDVRRVSKNDVLRVAQTYLENPAVAIIRPGRPATSPRAKTGV